MPERATIVATPHAIFHRLPARRRRRRGCKSPRSSRRARVCLPNDNGAFAGISSDYQQHIAPLWRTRADRGMKQPPSRPLLGIVGISAFHEALETDSARAQETGLRRAAGAMEGAPRASWLASGVRVCGWLGASTRFVSSSRRDVHAPGDPSGAPRPQGRWLCHSRHRGCPQAPTLVLCLM